MSGYCSATVRNRLLFGLHTAPGWGSTKTIVYERKSLPVISVDMVNIVCLILLLFSLASRSEKRLESFIQKYID